MASALDTNERLWHWSDFRAGASSLRFPLIALHLLHDTTTECHTGASHPGCCTGARISLRYEISQRNDHTFRCEFSLPVDWNGKLMRNVCDFESRVYFYQHEVYMKWLSHHVNAIRNQKVIPVLNSRRCELSHINTPQYPFLGASS